MNARSDFCGEIFQVPQQARRHHRGNLAIVSQSCRACASSSRFSSSPLRSPRHRRRPTMALTLPSVIPRRRLLRSSTFLNAIAPVRPSIIPCVYTLRVFLPLSSFYSHPSASLVSLHLLVFHTLKHIIISFLDATSFFLPNANTHRRADEEDRPAESVQHGAARLFVEIGLQRYEYLL